MTLPQNLKHQSSNCHGSRFFIVFFVASWLQAHSREFCRPISLEQNVMSHSPASSFPNPSYKCFELSSFSSQVPYPHNHDSRTIKMHHDVSIWLSFEKSKHVLGGSVECFLSTCKSTGADLYNKLTSYNVQTHNNITWNQHTLFMRVTWAELRYNSMWQ